MQHFGQFPREEPRGNQAIDVALDVLGALVAIHPDAVRIQELHQKNRTGELTEDELFVTASAAKEGVEIVNPSATDPLVMLKHFGPGNPDAEPLRRDR